MAKAQKDNLAIIEAPVNAVELPSVDHSDLPSSPFGWLTVSPCNLDPNPLDNPFDAFKVLHDKRRNPNPSKVQQIKVSLDEARKEETEARKWAHVTSCLVRDLDRLCVNPLIATYQQALEVAESDLLSVKMLLQSKLADLQFVRQELARLTGKTVKSGKVSSIGTSSNRSRDNADRFGLVGNESAFMSAVSQGSCTMKEALSRCGQVHPQYRLVERMVAAGYLVKVGNTLSLA